MLSTVFLQRMHRLLRAFDEATLFNRLVDLLDERHRNIQAFVGRIAIGSNINEAAGNIHANFVGIHECLQGISLRIVFRQGEQLLSALAEVGFDAENEALTLLGTSIQGFLERVDRYSTSRASAEAFDVVLHVADLRSRIAQTKAVIASMLLALEPAPAEEGFDSILVVMDGGYELVDIAETLSALDELCRRLTEVYQSCGLAATFSVRKIETGSLSWELVGERLGIFALKQLFSKGVDFWHRNRTIEGQLKYQVPLHANAIREAMKIRQLLDKEGIDTTRLDEALAEQAEFMVERIGIIARKAHDVNLDGRSLTPRAPYRLAAPTSASQPRLRHDDPSTGA